MRKIFIILALTSLSLSCSIYSSLFSNTDSSKQDQLCVPHNSGLKPLITLDGIYGEYSTNGDAQGSITNYLNAGATVDDLENYLSEKVVNSDQKIKTQVVTQDLTRDSIADIIVSLTLPAIPDYGDSIVAVFACEDGRYIRHNLFGRTGAGSRGENLYNSGGANIEKIQDLNSDGTPEIIFFISSLGELYIAEWDGRGFISLIQYSDELENMQTYISVQEGSFEFKDTNNDGNLEIVVTNRNSTDVWIWNGEYFQK